jgi:hypothetical protein
MVPVMGARSKAFWDGARRGVKFGAFVGVVIWMIIEVVCLGLILLIPRLREEALSDLASQSAFSAIGGLLAPLLLMVVYGAVPGAVIMGIAGMLRARRNASIEAN